MLRKTVVGVKHQKECWTLVWQKDMFSQQGNVSPCVHKHSGELRIGNGSKGGSGVDQVQSLLSSLFSVAENTTADHTQAAEDPPSRESLSPSGPCPGGKWNSWGRSSGGEDWVLPMVVMEEHGLVWDKCKEEAGEPIQARLVGRMGKRLVNKREKKIRLNNKGNVPRNIHTFTSKQLS